MITEFMKKFDCGGFLRRFYFCKRTMFFCEENLTHNISGILMLSMKAVFSGVLPIVEVGLGNF